MEYNVKSINVFERQAKRLIKKYPSLKTELLSLVHQLKLSPEKGVPLGHNCFKIRVAIASKGKGKSGGARVITNYLIAQNTVYLLSVYDKSEKDNLSDNELHELLQLIH